MRLCEDPDFLRAALVGFGLLLEGIDDAIADVRRRLRPEKRESKPRPSPIRRGRWPGGQRRWSAEELDRLRELYPQHPQKKVAELLGRTRPSVASKAKALGIGDRRYWTPEELEQVRALYPEQPTEQIAAQFGRPVGSVHKAAAKLGIKKSASFWRRPEFIEKVKSRPSFIANQFRKGHAPANKGVRRPGWAPGRMAETQFKKGQLNGRAAELWMPIGTIHADPEGFLRIKVRERYGAKHQNGWHPEVWPLLHHLVWEQHHGPVPEGHAIAFVDGNRANCAIENLECIHRRELARRNHWSVIYPRELTELIHLNAAIKRKLREFGHGEEQNVRSA